MPSKRSPEILELTWGSVALEDHGTLRDAKCWPGGARGWDWNETGTHHDPGIQVADVEELVENGAEHVILSKGQQERLQVHPDTLAWLDERGVEAEVLETNAAVQRYNTLARDGQAVGALVHSTC